MIEVKASSVAIKLLCGLMAAEKYSQYGYMHLKKSLGTKCGCPKISFKNGALNCISFKNKSSTLKGFSNQRALYYNFHQ